MNGLIDSSNPPTTSSTCRTLFPLWQVFKILNLICKRNSMNFHNLKKWQGMPMEWLRFAGRSAKNKFRLRVWVRNIHVPPKWRVLLSGWKKNSFCVGEKMRVAGDGNCHRWHWSLCLAVDTDLAALSIPGRRIILSAPLRDSYLNSRSTRSRCWKAPTEGVP